MQRLWPILACLVPVLVLLAVYAPTHGFFANQYDDVYITYRSVINWMHGEGLNFNAGEHTDAASSFLYAVILAGFWILDIHNLEFVGALVGVLSLGLICYLTYRLALVLGAGEKIACLVAIVCGLNGFMSGWTLSGMETMLWAAMVMWAIYAMAVRQSSIIVCLAIAAASFTRFEGVFLVASYALARWPRPDIKKDILPMGIFLLIFGVFYIVKYNYYHVWISHAYQMKRVADYYLPHPAEMIGYWRRFACLPLLLALPALAQRKNWYATLYIVLSFASVCFGPRSDWGRYSVHLLPLLYAFSAPLLERLVQSPRDLVKLGICTICMAGMTLQAAAGMVFNYRNMEDLAEHQICRRELGEYVRDHVPPDQTVASSDLGMISYMAVNHSFIDLMALTSPDVLAEYEKGLPADAVIQKKHISYYADTYWREGPNSGNRLDMLLEQFPKVKTKSGFIADFSQPEFSCTRRRGIYFGLTRLKPATPERT